MRLTSRTLTYFFTIVAVSLTAVSQAQERVPFIINGTPTEAFPAVGIVGQADVGGFCTGTLITPNHVLTAGHCGEAILSIGDEQSGTFELDGRVYRTAMVVIQDGYDPETFADDIAILVLEESVTDVEPMELATFPPEVGEVMTIVGYGGQGTPEEGSDGSFGEKLVGSATVDAVSDTEFLWDYDDATESNPAPGDSGSPVLIDTGETLLVAGIVSSGTQENAGLGDTNFNVRVDAYLDFISETIAVTQAILDEGPVVDDQPSGDEEPSVDDEPIANDDPTVDEGPVLDEGPAVDDEFFQDQPANGVEPGNDGTTTDEDSSGQGPSVEDSPEQPGTGESVSDGSNEGANGDDGPSDLPTGETDDQNTSDPAAQTDTSSDADCNRRPGGHRPHHPARHPHHPAHHHSGDSGNCKPVCSSDDATADAPSNAPGSSDASGSSDTSNTSDPSGSSETSSDDSSAPGTETVGGDEAPSNDGEAADTVSTSRRKDKVYRRPLGSYRDLRHRRSAAVPVYRTRINVRRLAR